MSDSIDNFFVRVSLSLWAVLIEKLVWEIFYLVS